MRSGTLSSIVSILMMASASPAFAKKETLQESSLEQFEIVLTQLNRQAEGRKYRIRWDQESETCEMGRANARMRLILKTVLPDTCVDLRNFIRLNKNRLISESAVANKRGKSVRAKHLAGRIELLDVSTVGRMDAKILCDNNRVDCQRPGENVSDQLAFMIQRYVDEEVGKLKPTTPIEIPNL